MSFMNTLNTVMTTRGQVSVPKEIRRHLHLDPGCRVVWHPVSETECRVTVVKSGRGGARAQLGFAGRFRAPRRTAEWMRELRSGEAR